MSIALSTLIPLPSADVNNDLIEPFIKACRLCLWKREKMIHFGQKEYVISKINACLPTSVNETDELPKYICCECFYKLNTLYEFHKMCARSDYILKSYIFKSGGRSTSTDEVSEKEKDGRVEAVHLFKQSCNSRRDGEGSFANERCSELVKTKDEEISLFRGIEKFPSSSKESETFLPRDKIMENKVQGYIKTDICNIKIEENCQFGDINDLDDILEIVKDKMNSEGGSSESFANCGFTPSSDLNIDSVYTLQSDNKENLCHLQASQLSEMFDENFDLNINSKNYGNKVTSLNNYKPNSVGETDVNLRLSKQCHIENKLENFSCMSSNLSSEINSIDDQKTTFTRKTRIDEKHPEKSNTDKGNEIGTSNAVCPGYSSSGEEKIKTEYKKSSYSNSLMQKASNDLQPEHLHSNISEVKPSDSKWKSYLWDRDLKLARQKSGRDPKLYQCNKCQKVLKNAYTLRQHMSVHGGEKPYKCPYCVRTFGFSFGFSVHIRTHTGERPYKCCECDRRFMDKPSLNTHMRIHTGLTPYCCNICPKQFSSKTSLNSHGKIHSELYAFSCCECSKDFKRFYSLNLHMRIHTGFRPYKCLECDYTFIKFAHLKQHLRVHTGYKPFRCVKCSKSFSQYSNLRVHVRKHVKEIKVENSVVCF